MHETAVTTTTTTARPLARSERRELAIFAVATVAAWAHTLDEIRIGELIAVPFGVVNAAVVAWWPRTTPFRRAVSAIAFGLFWGLAVIPYHIVPLLQGTVTGQHASGVTRLVGGAAMVALGVAILRRSRPSRSAARNATTSG